MKLHKKEIAKQQIETALELFFSKGDLFSVITLAGAGEEIIGKLLSREGKKSMMDHLVALDKKLTGTGRDFKTVNDEINGIRNSLKHAKKPSEDEIEFDSGHAIAMLARAVANYTSLEGVATDKMQQFYEYLKSLYPDVSP
jgi:hypothetical protein